MKLKVFFLLMTLPLAQASLAICVFYKDDGFRNGFLLEDSEAIRDLSHNYILHYDDRYRIGHDVQRLENRSFGSGFNNQISSVTVDSKKGCQAVFFSSPMFSGSALAITSNVDNLKRKNFDNRASSVTCKCYKSLEKNRRKNNEK